MHLLDLPLEDSLLRYLTAPSMAALEQTCRPLLAISRRDKATIWAPLVRERWGPVRLPTCWDAERARRVLPVWDGPTVAPATWRELLCYLEQLVRSWLLVSVKKAVSLLAVQGIIDDECSWHPTLRRLLAWAPLNEKRRIAAFVCADWQPASVLGDFLRPFPIIGLTPVLALRKLLMRFPFLPIDAGAGADRVIGWFSREYVLTNPHRLTSLGLGVVGSAAAVEGTAAQGGHEESISSSSSDEEVELQEAAEVQEEAGSLASVAAPLARAARLGLSPESFKAARDAVYTLLYSVIMLNTDLHNPAITPKIQPHEYVASCHRCVPLRHCPRETLLEIYESILHHPFQIAPSVDKVDTTIRCSQSADDTENGATLSVYSSVPSRVMSSGGSGGGGSHGSGGGGGGAHGGGAFGGGSTGGMAIGGQVRAGSATTAGALPAVDWSVAYWNVVDACRDLRRIAIRSMVPTVLQPHLPDSSRVLQMGSRAAVGVLLLALLYGRLGRETSWLHSA